MNKNTDHGKIINVKMKLDCKTVRNFAYSSTPRFTNFFTDFEKKNPTVLQSKMKIMILLSETMTWTHENKHTL